MLYQQSSINHVAKLPSPPFTLIPIYKYNDVKNGLFTHLFDILIKEVNMDKQTMSSEILDLDMDPR